MDDPNTPAAQRQGPRSEPRTAAPVPVDDAARERCRQRFWIAVVATVLAIAGMVVAIATAGGQDEPGQSRPVGVYVAAFIGTAGLFLALYAYRQARLRRVLTRAAWHRSTISLTTTGRGRSSQDHLTIEVTGLWYRPSNPLGAPGWLRAAHEVDWTGDPHGHIVVRLPDSPRLGLFRLEK